MKSDMADYQYFTPGMVVSCTTCLDQKIEGEVIGYDYEENLISLKSISKSGKANRHDLRIINLNNVVKVEEIREPTSKEILQLPALDKFKLIKRKRDNIIEKTKQLSYIGTGVTSEAQNILNYITKTICDVKWKDQDIIVMDKVVITSPYKPENCRPLVSAGSGQQIEIAVNKLKKVIEKYHREKQDKDL